MSLRKRILIAIVLINVSIIGILAALVLADAQSRQGKAKELREAWIEAENRRVSRLLSVVIDSQLDESLVVKTLLSWAVWAEIEDAVIINTEVDEEFTINPNGARGRFLRSTDPLGGLDGSRVRERIAEAMEKGDSILDGDWVAAPVSYLSADEGRKVPWGGIYFKPRPLIDVAFNQSLVSIPNLMLVTGLGTAVMILVTYVLLSRLVLRPVDLLLSASGRVAQGDFSLEIPKTGLESEMARLVTGFNAMARDVRDYRHHLEEKIQETREKVEKTQKGLVIAQRLAATGKLAAGIAHEINNPLGGMINMSRSMISRDVGKEKQAEYLQLILSGLYRIQETVRRVLTFSPRELRAQVVDLGSVAEQAVALVRHRLVKDGIVFEFAARRPGELSSVFGDAGEIQQALLNLLLNAIDSVRDQEKEARLKVFLSEDASGVQVVIEDNGCGMTKEQLERAFDLFYTTKEVGEGTGLGLSMVHHIIAENHAGAVDLTSEPGRGTRVVVTLPPDSGRSRSSEDEGEARPHS